MGRNNFDNGNNKASGRDSGTFKKGPTRGNAPVKKKGSGPYSKNTSDSETPSTPLKPSGANKKGFRKIVKRETFSSNPKGSRPKVDAPTKPKDPSDTSIRLNRYISNSGVSSRREADIFIAAGSVKVNGKAVVEMGYKVQLTDVVTFDDRVLNPEKRVYILLNKPRDFDSASKDPTHPKSAIGLVANATKVTLKPIGRLDKSASGLLLYSNDGELITKLTKPKNGFRKIYHATLEKALKADDLEKIRKGIVLEDGPVRIHEISHIKDSPATEVGIEILSAKNNIIKRIFEYLGYELIKLDRVVYAGLTKKDLPRGQWRNLTGQEVINLKMIQ
ncbi:MAG: pseudouridine synthase [Flavobacteriaceae bacterium]|tara:strand:- start:16316 stop:17311 length:996 start_codon:yes stop_codon:yes gene_type:complete